MRKLLIWGLSFGLIVSAQCVAADEKAAPLRIALFRVDATPPLGSPLCDGAVPPVVAVDDSLTARGIVFLGEERPIVICAVDWVGIGNAGHRAWREALAAAAGTDVSRVAVHTLHQHDAPGCDFAADEILASAGHAGAMFDTAFARRTIDAAAAAVKASLNSPQQVTHIGLGRAKVDRVAANRRVLGPDGKVQYVRWSFTEQAEARAAPEGVIDPYMQAIALYDGDRPVVSLTYYATHPQSYHGRGHVSGDTVGLARAVRERELPDVAHIHFAGAAGNITVGKYYDGTPASRDELASRIADGMRAAWKAIERRRIKAADVSWRSEPVVLPVSPLIDEEQLRATLKAEQVSVKERVRVAMDLSFVARTQRADPVDIGCLRLGDTYVMHMPAELFIEYQLAAQEMRPGSVVAMAAYGDYGAGYIGTEIAYSQGGYETGIASRVAPSVERVLMEAMAKLLK